MCSAVNASHARFGSDKIARNAIAMFDLCAVSVEFSSSDDQGRFTAYIYNDFPDFPPTETLDSSKFKFTIQGKSTRHDVAIDRTQ